MPQSKAIERYVAKKYGMMGSTPEEEALIDGFAEHNRDIADAYRKVSRDKDGKLEAFLAEDLPKSLALLEKAIASKPGPFMLGDKVSLADVLFFVFLTENIADSKALPAYESLPKLKAAIDAVANLDSIKAYQEKRPVTAW